MKINNKGQALVEYVLIIALISVLAISLVSLLGGYLKDSMTAMTIKEQKNRRARRTSEKTTAETVYYWMIECGIPFECQYWNFNRLIALIEMCSINSQPQKKMSKREILAQNDKINAMRRQAAHSKG